MSMSLSEEQIGKHVFKKSDTLVPLPNSTEHPTVFAP
jgi:hypothetical protein